MDSFSRSDFLPPETEQRPPLKRVLLMLSAGLLVLAAIWVSPQLQKRVDPNAPSAGLAADLGTETPTTAPTRTLAPSRTASPSPTSSSTPTLTAQPDPLDASLPEFSPFTGSPLDQGLIVLAVREAGYSHLFAYHPGVQPSLLRLTSGAWDDITPAISPEGERVAFASNRDGQWDLYILDLRTGQTLQATDTPAYEAHPTFSPDGLWLAYETYQPGPTTRPDETPLYSLDIYILSLEDTLAEPIPLVNGPAADYAPAWSPHGRQVAFVSDRSGESEIWIAYLDRYDDRFVNVSRSRDSQDSHPAWAPDGRRLAWAAIDEGGVRTIMTQEMSADEGVALAAQGLAREARSLGAGSWPAWSPDGGALLSGLIAPNASYLTGYIQPGGALLLPPLALPGSVEGLAWGSSDDLWQVESRQAWYGQAARHTPQPLWQPQLTPVAGAPGGRQALVQLEGVDAPQPLLHDMVDESFAALRQAIGDQAGWDLLAALENATVPLTALLSPGMEKDWLYTGRAFAFTPLPVNAGWMVVVREDFGPQTYWRVYLRARYQDGRQGRPLHEMPWNFNARTSGEPRAYEAGGAPLTQLPQGYWVDLTELAAAYSWQRLPALNTWRAAYPSARFNVLALTDGLDWTDAMLDIYPAGALVTPTVVYPTRIPSTATPIPTRKPTATPTRRPTQTPAPSPTP
jgi:TolB protein